MNRDLGLLILRVGAGVMMATHGWGKVVDLFSGNPQFGDPLGIGPVPSLALAAFAEFLCALLVVVGFKVRWTAIPIVITMLVAAFVVHAADGWGKQEFPLLYAVAFLTLVFTGAGQYSLDALFGQGRVGKGRLGRGGR
jgi:putative oxidoreductase